MLTGTGGLILAHDDVQISLGSSVQARDRGALDEALIVVLGGVGGQGRRHTGDLGHVRTTASLALVDPVAFQSGHFKFKL